MLTLLVTSVLISQAVFAFLPLNSTFTARQVHTLVGYLALIIAAIHLGLHWTMIMGFVRSRLGIRVESRWASIALRGLAVVIAAFGVHSLFALNVGSKLLMQTSMEFWDFETSTPAFFFHLVRHNWFLRFFSPLHRETAAGPENKFGPLNGGDPPRTP